MSARVVFCARFVLFAHNRSLSAVVVLYVRFKIIIVIIGRSSMSRLTTGALPRRCSSVPFERRRHFSLLRL